jgi:hypothetical protein
MLAQPTCEMKGCANNVDYPLLWGECYNLQPPRRPPSKVQFCPDAAKNRFACGSSSIPFQGSNQITFLRFRTEASTSSTTTLISTGGGSRLWKR